MIRAVSTDSTDSTEPATADGGAPAGPTDADNGSPAGPGVIDDAGRPPRPAPRWDCGPDGVLVLTVPPPPAWRRLVAPGAVLAGATALAAGPAALATAIPSAPGAWPVVLLLGLTAVGLWVLALRRLRRAARDARLPSTVRVDAATLSMTVPGSAAGDWLQWPREQVRDLRVTATGVLPVVQEYLWVRVERQPPDSGPATAAVVRIPWAMPLPPAGVVGGIEDRLREAVGLPAAKRAVAAAVAAPAGG